MNTQGMINALVADATPAGLSFQKRFFFGILAAASLSGALFYALYGVRDDITGAMGQYRFVFKLVYMALLSVVLWRITLAAARPMAPTRADILPIIVMILLFALVVGIELSVTPQPYWQSRLIGQNAEFCLLAIPLLGLPVLALAITIMRRAAPSHVTLAGLIAGLFSGAVGSTIYAMHCPDDSPLFIGVWYGLAISALALLGAALGNRFLRW